MLLLCMSAGMVDVIGYLGLGHVLTANMTGNIVLLGIAIARAQEFVVLRSLLALIGFIAGMRLQPICLDRLKPKWLVPSGHRRIHRRKHTTSAVRYPYNYSLFEPFSYLLIVLLAVAMGMQTTAARRIGIAGISTTVLTNNLAAVIEDAVSILHRLKHAKIRSLFKALSTDAYLRAGAVVIYLGGSSWLHFFSSCPLVAVWVPVLVIAGVTLQAIFSAGEMNKSRRQPE